MESSCSVILKPCNTAVNNTEGGHQRPRPGTLALLTVATA